MSANSYGLEPCRWMAENVLKHCVNLKRVNFSDIFTTRAREVLPPSLKLLIGAITDKPIVDLDLSANAFGPDGVRSFVSFLETCPTLEALNVTNCGLGPEGGKMIAAAIMKNKHMHLKEFYASRDRLENPGIEALSAVFVKHHTLQKIEVYQNGIRLGLTHLFKALLSCKDTIRYVDVSDNVIKRSTAELVAFIRTCTGIRYLNLSDCLIKKNQQAEVIEAVVSGVRQGSQLQEFVWNQDASKATVMYMIGQMALIRPANLKKLEMTGIFTSKATREGIKK